MAPGSDMPSIYSWLLTYSSGREQRTFGCLHTHEAGNSIQLAATYSSGRKQHTVTAHEPSKRSLTISGAVDDKFCAQADLWRCMVAVADTASVIHVLACRMLQLLWV